MKISSIDKDIKEILDSGYYKIPRFQRPYSWKREHVEEFWNDVIVESDTDYFIGSMVVYPFGDGTWGVVDGQQRLTTITMLLCALRNTLENEGFKELAKGIHGVIERPDIDNKKQYILQTETSYPYLQEQIQKIGHSDFSGDLGQEEKKIRDAFTLLTEYLTDFVNSINSDPTIKPEIKTKRLKSKLTEIRDKTLSLKTIFITLDKDDDAYTVFETLNTRGENLRIADLVKNYLTKLIKPSNKNVDLAKDKWNEIAEIIEGSEEEIEIDNFIHHYWLSKYTYTSTKRLFKLLKKKIKKNNAEEFLNDLVMDVYTYREIHETSYRKWDNQESEIKESLNALLNFRVKQQLPMVLSVLREYKKGDIKLKHAKEILGAIENFHFIFTAVTSQRSSGGISSMYASSARKLAEASTAEEKLAVLRELIKKLREKKPGYAEFEANFIEIGYSKKRTKQKRLVQYILRKIDKHNAKGISIDFDKMTIEHLSPENPKEEPKIPEEIIAKIGNLMLMSQELNNKLANKRALKKIESIGNDSQIILDEILVNASQSKKWGENEIHERTLYFSHLAYDKIWN